MPLVRNRSVEEISLTDMAAISPASNSKTLPNAGTSSTTSLLTALILLFANGLVRAEEPAVDCPGSPLDGRTEKVVQAIIAAVEGVDDCRDIAGEHLAGITLLDLSGVELESLRSKDFAGLSRLEKLALPDNRLTALPPGLFDGLINLKKLFLDNNSLNELAPETFRDLTALQQLWLNGNRLERLPEGLFAGPVALDMLNLTGNRLLTLETRPFAGLTRLRRLWLNHNLLPALAAESFRDLVALESLNLANNRLVALESAPFADLRALRTLELNHNRLDRLTALSFRGLGDLERLNLAHNRLTAIRREALDELPRLRDLQLHGNSLALELKFDRTPRTLMEGQELNYRVTLFSPPPSEVGVTPSSDHPEIEITPSELIFTADNWNQPQNFTVKTAVDLDAENERATIRHRLVAEAKTTDSLFDLSVTVDDTFPSFIDLPGNPLHGRTEAIANAILTAIQGADSYSEITEERLTALSGLSITDTNIHFLKPDDLAGLTGLKHLYIGTSQISELPPTVFDDLSELQVLTITYNPLTELPPDLFAKLGNLTSVRLSRNRLARLPPGLFRNLKKLKTLDVAYNQLTEWQADLLQGLDELQRLNLGNNRLTSLPEDSFRESPGLQYLTLDNNQLEVIPEGLFDGLTKLQTLSLESNALTRLPSRAFDRLSDLKSIDLNGNPLQQELLHDSFVLSLNEGHQTTYTVRLFSPPEQPVTIEPFSDLEEVTVEPEALAFTADNWDSPQFVTITAALDDNDEKEVATIRYRRRDEDPANEFSTFVTVAVQEPETLLDCPDSLLHGRTRKVAEVILKAIDAVDDCAEITAEHLNQIKSLSFGGTELSTLNSGDFAGLTSMSTLNLSGNFLSELPADIFSGLTNLSYLTLNENQLNLLPAGIFTNLTKLRTLSLNNNQLSQLDRGLFEGLKQLSNLSLQYNRLTAIPGNTFESLKSLRTLNLIWNQLESIDSESFSGLTSLRYLYLGNNRISALSPDAFEDVGNLSYLTLNNNRLSALEPGQFDALGTMRSLNLSHNRLTSLPPDLFRSLPELQYVNMQFNLELKRELHLNYIRLATDEGDTAEYTAQLFSPPEAEIVVTPTTDHPRLTFDPPIFSFDSEDWNQLKSIKVKIPNDVNDADEKILVRHRLKIAGTSFYSSVNLQIQIRDLDPLRNECVNRTLQSGRLPGKVLDVVSKPGERENVAVQGDRRPAQSKANHQLFR